MTSLKASDAKEVASSVTAIANEKLKAEKEANAGKKKTGMPLLSLSSFSRLRTYETLVQVLLVSNILCHSEILVQKSDSYVASHVYILKWIYIILSIFALQVLRRNS